MKNKVAVILDAGHGFNTPGKRSNDGSLRENEFNNAVLNKVSLLLDLAKIKYSILVPEWNDIHLYERVEREHKLNKDYSYEGYTPILISIHANAAPQTQAKGIETFAVSDAGYKLASFIHEGLSNAYQNPRYDRGIKSANFTMLTNTASPACLIECGFMTNKDDLELLKSDKYRNRLAVLIAEYIVRYQEDINKNKLA